jgi:polyisoprenyl-phosphate glycosyltransferase
MAPVFSIIAPIFNEAESIGPFLERLVPVLDGLGESYEIVFVNDGSGDDSLRRLIERRKSLPELRIVDLSRNFGKEAALTAGLDHARGQAMIPIDCDLQDPPELIPELVRHWRAGAEIVRAHRQERPGDGWTKRLSAALFYRLHNRLAETPIPPNVGDFCLLDRRVVDALAGLRERKRFMKGLFAWVGFRQATVEYVREARSQGASKWRYWKLWNFALDGITGFSTAPLRLWTYVGAVIAAAAFVYAMLTILRVMAWGVDVPGYASLLTVVLFMGGVQLITLGVIGEYIGRIYIEAKGRPLYLVRQCHESPESPAPQSRRRETIDA